jgi:flagellar hook-associated protein 3 FlgL
MRVTDASLFRIIQQRVQSAQQNLQNAATPVTTGKIVNSLEDDPLVLQKMLRHDREEADLAQYKSTQSRQISKYGAYETAVEETYQILVGIQTTMVQLSNPHQPEDVRNQLTGELTQMREHLLSIANTEQEGQYIFAGARTDVPAYDDNGVYQGDDLELQVEILPGIKMEGNMTGQALFGGVGINNGENVFATIDSVLGGIASGDPQTAIQNHLDQMDQLINQTAMVRTQVGVRLSRLELAQSTISQLELTLAEKRQNFEDVDYVTALTDYKAAEYSLEATMQASGNLIKPTLLDYLK